MGGEGGVKICADNADGGGQFLRTHADIILECSLTTYPCQKKDHYYGSNGRNHYNVGDKCV